MRRRWIWAGAAGVALLAGIGIAVFGLPGRGMRVMAPGGRAAAEPAYVGSQACAGCHQREDEAWQASQHALAMQEANERTVLGDFGGWRFTYAGVTSTFIRRDGKFFVRTDGPEGRLADFEVKYTFGVEPLQQYLIELPGGRLQALSIAWDTRPRRLGGQRWFHLYPAERITHRDELHWTGRQQNWNFMCADCHSTNVRKRYDARTGNYATTWSEINVACEACHGPGSRHVAWAEAARAGRAAEVPRKGLTVALDERRGVTWTLDAKTGTAARSRSKHADTEIEICAQCHSRRSQFAEGYAAGKPFPDHYLPTLLSPGLYHADGQIQDEVYEYGSFLQSKMYRAGVTCSDCHDPHSGALRAAGNGVCTQCHLPATFDAPAHHHHPAGSEGARCVSCHMPAKTYMVVDPRRDHSFRVPRPDRSVALGVPNACDGCHRDRGAAWAAERVRAWYGRDAVGFQRFAEAFHRADQGDPRAAAALAAIASDLGESPIVRASALARLPSPVTPAALRAVQAALRDASPLVRHAALGLVDRLPPPQRPPLAAPVLGDPVRAVRMEAARVLAPVRVESLGAGDRETLARAAEEYVAGQRLHADRPEHRTNLGTFFAQRGQFAEAEAEFRAALALDRRWVPAYVNAADLYRLQGRDADGIRLLREGLAAAPNDATLHHALGLALARAKELPEAVKALERAARLAPGSSRFAYAYAVALHSTGRGKEAIRTLEAARARHPNDRDLLMALAAFQRDAGARAEALRAAERLGELFPDDPEAQGLLRELRAPARR